MGNGGGASGAHQVGARHLVFVSLFGMMRSKTSSPGCVFKEAVQAMFSELLSDPPGAPSKASPPAQGVCLCSCCSKTEETSLVSDNSGGNGLQKERPSSGPPARSPSAAHGERGARSAYLASNCRAMLR